MNITEWIKDNEDVLLIKVGDVDVMLSDVWEKLPFDNQLPLLVKYYKHRYKENQ